MTGVEFLTKSVDELYMKTLLSCVMLFCSGAFADDWICTKQASLLQGDDLIVCGIGMGMDEAMARRSAFNEAQGEFDRICRASTRCPHREITVEPGRTECKEPTDTVGPRGLWKCYRAVTYHMSE